MKTLTKLSIIVIIFLSSCAPVAYMTAPESDGNATVFIETSSPGKQYELIVNDSIWRTRMGNGRQLSFGKVPFESRFYVQKAKRR